MDRRGHMNSGVTLALGSDIGAGYERSMVRVARAMVEAAASLAGPEASEQDQVPTADHAWWQITAGNAQALGWPDAGRLVPGAAADVVVAQPDIGWLSGPVDPLSRLLWAWDDRWVKQTLIRGRPAFTEA